MQTLVTLLLFVLICFGNQTKGNEELINVSKSGNFAAVKQLVNDKSIYVNFKDYGGWTPLHHASKFGYYEIVKLLIENGADINSKNNDAWTPLHQASYKGYYEIVKLLIENGADINSKEKYGRTPHYYASSKGHIEIVKLLEGKYDEERIKLEAKHKHDEAEAKRKHDEEKRKHDEDEAEAKRRHDEAEAKRKHDEAEAKRRHEEEERIKHEAEAKTRHEEEEAKRKHTHTIHFAVKAEVSFGEVVAVIGSSAVLGNWKVEHVKQLEWTSGNIWKGSVTFEEEGEVQYKYVILSSDLQSKWEPGDNRILRVPSTSVLEDYFGSH